MLLFYKVGERNFFNLDFIAAILFWLTFFIGPLKHNILSKVILLISVPIIWVSCQRYKKTKYYYFELIALLSYLFLIIWVFLYHKSSNIATLAGVFIIFGSGVCSLVFTFYPIIQKAWKFIILLFLVCCLSGMFLATNNATSYFMTITLLYTAIIFLMDKKYKNVFGKIINYKWSTPISMAANFIYISALLLQIIITITHFQLPYLRNISSVTSLKGLIPSILLFFVGSTLNPVDMVKC